MTTLADSISSSSAMEVENRYASGTNRPQEEGEEAMTTLTKKETTNAPIVFSPELLQMYYSRLFPFDLLHTWLRYRGGTEFSRREFSFTIEPVPGEEVYIRYQSFPGQAELAAAILKRRPVKIDIGAIFSHPPKDHAAFQTSFAPEQRELVFDIDLTDYDEVRQCGCSGAAICPTCWRYMNMAVKVMDQGLKEDFGFQHVGWFYSGRRGVHAWVCDAAARALTDEGRSAVANYFEVNLGTDKNKEVKLSHPLHPMLARAYQVLEPLFIESVLPASGHGILATEAACHTFLDALPEAASRIKDKLSEIWFPKKKKNGGSHASTPAQKWAELQQHLHIFLGQSSKAGTVKAAKHMTTKDRNRLELWPVEMVFRYTYPRLDINVSKMRNHLLKSPFCVHPKTGRVCVPFEASKVDEFDPFGVPTLPQLMDELDQFAATQGDDEDDDKKETGGRTVKDWQKTSLKQYLEPFEKSFLEPLVKEQRRQSREAAEQQAALTGDF